MARPTRKVVAVRPRTNYLLEQSYGPAVTRLDRPAFGNAPSQDAPASRTGPVRSAPVPFTCDGVNPLIIAQSNPNRLGLKLQNKDPINNLFYSFGPIADATCAFLAPGTTLLLDFVTPTDQVSVFATATVSGHYDDYSRQAE
jgi:hypothetical protein